MKTESSYTSTFFKRVIATQEKSAGNAEIGDMWIETKSFPDDTPIRDIMEWAGQCGGKLIITWDESSNHQNQENENNND
jgi:hypothetical protein